jgi:hypothetical protein
MKITFGVILLAIVFYFIGARWPGLASRFLPGA